jgi:hypothetical protein
MGYFKACAALIFLVVAAQFVVKRDLEVTRQYLYRHRRVRKIPKQTNAQQENTTATPMQTVWIQKILLRVPAKQDLKAKALPVPTSTSAQ